MHIWLYVICPVSILSTVDKTNFFFKQTMGDNNKKVNQGKSKEKLESV